MRWRVPKSSAVTRFLARSVLEALLEDPERITYPAVLGALGRLGVKHPAAAVPEFLREAEDMGAAEVIIVLARDMAARLAGAACEAAA